MDLFPYRNDLRKVLIPYLESLDTTHWNRTTPVYPNSLAWIVSHISTSEDYWVNEVLLKKQTKLTVNENSNPPDILNSYIQIRNYTDKILNTYDSIELNKLVKIPKFTDGWVPPSIPTVKWLFNHVYTHEAYHVGQIAVIASMNGFKKPLF